MDSLNEIENPTSNAVTNFLNLLDFDTGKILCFADIPAFIYLFEREIYPKKKKYIFLTIPIDKRYNLFYKS